jgi:hypothetical protein
MRLLIVAALTTVLTLIVAAPAARAGVYEGGGTLGKSITVCFVGDALTKRPERVEQILTAIKQFEYVANIRFTSLGACPPPKPDAAGNDVFEGDLRVVIPGISVDATGTVPGKGCSRSDNKGWGSWGTFPRAKERRRHCLFTVKLGDDPWRGEPYLNHTLHEFGHALGLAHEHIRVDADASRCNDKHIGGTTTAGLLTVYDPESVMHYSGSAACNLIGNYGRNGFSEKDKLALHILYPPDVRVAEFVGDTVVREGENLWLVFAWRRRGALVANVARNFEWKIDGKVVAQTPDLDRKVDVGVHTLEYRYFDFLDRDYTYKGTVRVLPKDGFTNTIAAPIAARGVLF